MTAILDTALLLDLEAGDERAWDIVEKLRKDHKIGFLPISSHELVYQAITKSSPLALPFLLKAIGMGIKRENLTPQELCYAKNVADDLVDKKLVNSPNLGELFGEAAAANKRDNHFLILTPNVANRVNASKIAEVIKEHHLNPAKIINVNKI